MIPGTRARTAKTNSPSSAETIQPEPSRVKTIDRRELFQSLIPALGVGVAKIVRSSNNLRRDLVEEIEERSRLKQGKAEEQN